MPKYHYSRDQTLLISHGLVFFKAWSFHVVAFPTVAVLGFLALLVAALLVGHLGLGLYAGICGYLVTSIGAATLASASYRTEILVDKDGTITRTQRFVVPLSIKTFKKGSYRLAVDETRSVEPNLGSDWPITYERTRYRVSVLEENGKRSTLLVVRTPAEIGEFKEAFTGFTNIDVFTRQP